MLTSFLSEPARTYQCELTTNEAAATHADTLRDERDPRHTTHGEPITNRIVVAALMIERAEWYHAPN